MNLREREIINNFSRKHCMGRIVWNAMRFDQSKKYSDDHRRMIFEICNWLYKNSIQFATGVDLGGYKPDIICPTHVKSIIEVRVSETNKETAKKNILNELKNEIIYVDGKQEFYDKLIL